MVSTPSSSSASAKAGSVPMCRATSSLKLRVSAISPSWNKRGAGSGNLIDRKLLGDAAQRTLLRYRTEPAGREQCRGLRVLDHRPGRQDRARVGQALHARRDVYGSAEIILPVVEHDRQAGALMNADFEQ